MTRRALLSLPVFAVDQAIDSCELDAVAKWNKFAETSGRYLKLRQEGVRSAKERQRMVEQFRDVINHECF
jgi:hypothetical protein